MTKFVVVEIEMTAEGIAILIDKAKAGDESALAELFNKYKKQLRTMISFRMDRNLKGRVDPSDILQEAYLDLAKRLPKFEQKNMSFFVWLRLVASERLLKTHEQHIKTQKRDARREVSFHCENAVSATSMSLAEHLLGRYTSVAGKAIKAEQRVRLQSILDDMDDTDREIIALRIFEELTNGEAAEILGIAKQTASKRFMSALGRLRKTLGDMPGF